MEESKVDLILLQANIISIARQWDNGPDKNELGVRYNSMEWARERSMTNKIGYEVAGMGPVFQRNGVDLEEVIRKSII